MWFQRKQNEGRKRSVVAFFDIGTASVGGALVFFDGTKPPMMLYGTREVISVKKITNPEQLTKSMLSVFLDTLLTLQSEGLPIAGDTLKIRNGRIDAVVCAYSSPWSLSIPSSVMVREEAPFSVSEKYIDELIEGEKSTFFEKVHHEDDDISKPHLIEYGALTITMNGYPTSLMRAKEVTSLQLDLLFSAIPEGIFNETQKLIKQLGPRQDAVLLPFTTAAFSTLRDLYPTNNDFLFLHVTSESTDVGVVYRDSLTETHSFPSGKHVLLRTIAEFLHIPFQEVPSLLHTHLNGELSSVETGRVTQALTIAENEWSNAFNAALQALASHVIIPNHLFLFVDEPYEDWFRSILEKVPYTHTSVSEKTFTVTPVGRESLRQFISAEPEKYFDPYIAVAALHYRKKVLRDL